MNSFIVSERLPQRRVQATSPLMFESDDDDTLVEEGPANGSNKENGEKGEEPTREEQLLKGFQTVLMGIPPPPAFTVPQLDSREILKLWRDHQRFQALMSPNRVSAKKGIAEKSENEAKSTKWPEVMRLDHWGICYNKSSVSEDVERLAVRYKERYVGAETSSCINSLYAKSPVRTASARKRARHHPWGHSPGRRLSHLARRRKAFSSASLCSVAGNNNPDKKMIMVEIKKIGCRQKKKNSAKKTKPTPKKKNLVQVNTFKRALFQSPDQLPVTKGAQTPSSQCIQRSKRNLFAESSSEKKVNDNGKRARRTSPRKRVNRSLSFQETTHPGTLTAAHKQKMLWAATNALREEGMGMSHELFRPCMTVLFKTCQKLWLSDVGKQSQEGSTSENMLALARKFTAHTIKEISSDPTSEHMAMVFNNNIKMAGNTFKQADLEVSSIDRVSCDKLLAEEKCSNEANVKYKGIPGSPAGPSSGIDSPVEGSVELQTQLLKESALKTEGRLKKMCLSTKQLIESEVNQWEVGSTVLSDENGGEKKTPVPAEEMESMRASPALTSLVTRSEKALMGEVRGRAQSPDLTSPKLCRMRVSMKNLSAKKESGNDSPVSKNQPPIAILGFHSSVAPLKSVSNNVISDKNEEWLDSRVKSNKSFMASPDLTSPVGRLKYVLTKDMTAKSDKKNSPAQVNQSPAVSPHSVLSRRRSKRISSNGSSISNEDKNNNPESLSLEGITSPDVTSPKMCSKSVSNLDNILKMPSVFKSVQTAKPLSQRASVKTPLKGGQKKNGRVKNITLKETVSTFPSTTKGSYHKNSPVFVKYESEECLSQRSNCSQLETDSERDIETNKENIDVEKLISDSDAERDCSGQKQSSGGTTPSCQKVQSGSNNRTLELYRLSNRAGEHMETDESGQTEMYADAPKLVPHWEQEGEGEETSSSDSPPSLAPHWESCSGTSTSLPESIMAHWHQMSNNLIPSEKIMFDFEDTSYEIDFPSTNDDTDTRASSTCAPFDFPHLALVDDSKSSGFNTFSRTNSPEC